jgi:aspartokinase/homoserine dehydrogenase 1
LSGTLNYLFSTYKGGEDGKTFAAIVKDAQAKGYTEPDPRLDLSGRDVLRKLLILSREAGVPLEESEIDNKVLLRPEFFEGNVDDFYEGLAKHEKDFATLYNTAASKGNKLRFIATLCREANGGFKASMGLQEVGVGHPLFNLNGTDNAAIITTSFYPSPLVIQGAGAGARQTASGVLNDILL